MCSVSLDVDGHVTIWATFVVGSVSGMGEWNTLHPPWRVVDRFCRRARDCYVPV